jgi:hypothetical protein
MEQAVLVWLKLSGGQFGTTEEQMQIYALEEKLEAIIRDRAVGEFDGHEFGEGRCVLFMYGADADRLFDAIQTELKLTPISRSGAATKRYGSADDSNARETQVSW